MLRTSVYLGAVAACVAGVLAAPAEAAAPGATVTRDNTPIKGVSLVRPVNLGKVSSSLAWRLPAFASDPRLRGLLAYDVVDQGTGQVVSSRYGYRTVMPASTFKILTAVVALRVIGADARSATEVLELPSSASLPNVTRVALVGGGDSLVTSDDLRSLMPAIVAKMRADGNESIQLSIDDSLFAPPTNATGWPAKYVPGVIAPVRALERDRRRSMDTSDEVGRWFTTQLRTLGVPVTYAGRTVAPIDAPTIVSFRGYTTAEAVRRMLLYSDNDVAEHLARLTAIAGGEEPTWTGWRDVALGELRTLRINVSGLRLYDGSGLSREDRLTPAALVTLLRQALDASRYPQLRSLLIDAPGAFPVAGKTGTLKLRFTSAKSKCAQGKVRAKTGFLTGTQSLAGVATGVDGRTRVFAIVLNNQPPKTSDLAVRAALDEMAATVTGCTFAK